MFGKYRTEILRPHSSCTCHINPILAPRFPFIVSFLLDSVLGLEDEGAGGVFVTASNKAGLLFIVIDKRPP